MRKINFRCLSALVLTVAGLTSLGMTTTVGQFNSQVAARVEATAPSTLAETDEATKARMVKTHGQRFAQGTSPAWPKISLTKRFSGLSQPVHVTHAGDRSNRLFVVEQRGRIRIVKNGVLLNTPFLDITSSVSCCGEQGLLSVAFPPNYASKKYFYVYYTNLSGNIVIARYRVTADPDVANSSTQEVVLTITHQPYANHNGGQLAFGSDGYLYIGTGDGGGSGDPQNNGQNRASLLGKMLRIDVESGSTPYAIPPSNPFRQTAGYLGEIWALGLRNPWRFSFDRQTGDLYIGDVGQGAYEEVDFQVSSSKGGQNYGWKIMEGAHCFNSTTCNQSGLVLPVAEYNHEQGRSITGGAVYRGQNYLDMHGVYFYADFVSGRIWGLRRNGTAWQNTLLSDTPYGIVSFGEDEAGNLYFTNYFNGDIYSITSTRSCTITGTSGNNTLQGTTGADVICGLGGNDTINGGGGIDLIYGDDGNDIISGGSGDDVIQASSGTDTISGDDGDDTIYGSSGIDTISGGNGNDFLEGGEDNDTFDGGPGTDTCIQDVGTGSKTSCEK